MADRLIIDRVIVSIAGPGAWCWGREELRAIGEDVARRAALALAAGMAIDHGGRDPDFIPSLAIRLDVETMMDSSVGPPDSVSHGLDALLGASVAAAAVTAWKAAVGERRADDDHLDPEPSAQPVSSVADESDVFHGRSTPGSWPRPEAGEHAPEDDPWRVGSAVMPPPAAARSSIVGRDAVHPVPSVVTEEETAEVAALGEPSMAQVSEQGIDGSVSVTGHLSSANGRPQTIHGAMLPSREVSAVVLAAGDDVPDGATEPDGISPFVGLDPGHAVPIGDDRSRLPAHRARDVQKRVGLCTALPWLVYRGVEIAGIAPVLEALFERDGAHELWPTMRWMFADLSLPARELGWYRDPQMAEVARVFADVEDDPPLTDVGVVADLLESWRDEVRAAVATASLRTVWHPACDIDAGRAPDLAHCVDAGFRALADVLYELPEGHSVESIRQEFLDLPFTAERTECGWTLSGGMGGRYDWISDFLSA